MKKVILPSVIVLLLIPISAAWGVGFSIGPNYSELEVSGSIESNGTSVSLGTDLNISEDSPAGFTLELGSGAHRVRLDYASVEFSGENVLTRQFTFENKVYTIGSLTQSKLAYDLAEFTYYYDAFGQGGTLISPCPGLGSGQRPNMAPLSG